jgi:hypothetical protein
VIWVEFFKILDHEVLNTIKVLWIINTHHRGDKDLLKCTLIELGLKLIGLIFLENRDLWLRLIIFLLLPSFLND